MYLGFYNLYEVYNNNRMFSDPSSPIGDDLLYPMVFLGDSLRRLGHRVNTIDLESDLSVFDSIIFLDFPGAKNRYFNGLVKQKNKNLYLFLNEMPVVKPENYDPKNHVHFKKVFTWMDDLIDNKKYFKINIINKIFRQIDFDLSQKTKFCALIAGNKYFNRPYELYSERIRAIRWFEKNAHDEFDLYGMGWDRFNFRRPLSRLNRFSLLTKLLAPSYPSYRGKIQSKRLVLNQYKFSICYENTNGYNGCITEKIFDCFFAGCVPIYLGAPNITTHLPANTFIDKRNFSSYPELYRYLKSMDDREYLGYIEAIRDFIRSDKTYPFSPEFLRDQIVNEIINDKAK